MAFGDLLCRERTSRKISLRDLGKAVDLSAIYLSDIERGSRKPPALQVVRRIAEALKADPGPFLTSALQERLSLDLAVRDAKRQEAALALARAWDDMGDDDIEDLIRLLSSPKGGVRRNE